MSLETIAANVAPPLAYDATKPGSGVYCRANTASSVRYTLPTDWKTNYVTFGTKGDDIYVLFGGASVTITLPQVSSLSGEDLTPVAGTAYYIPAGAEKNFLIPDDDALTKFAVYGGGTTGHWFAYMSVNQRVRK